MLGTHELLLVILGKAGDGRGAWKRVIGLNSKALEVGCEFDFLAAWSGASYITSLGLFLCL